MRPLSPTERRIYQVMRGKAGKIATYDELESVLSVRNGSSNLRVVVSRLRRIRGLPIESIRSIGYRLKAPKMPVIIHDIATQEYVEDLQVSMAAAMGRHAESVGFEDQVAIIGVAIGSLLAQLPEPDREYFTNILIDNVRCARRFSTPMRMQ